MWIICFVQGNVVVLQHQLTKHIDGEDNRTAVTL